MKQVQVGQILQNKLSTGQSIIVRVIELNVAGTDMPRVTDARETATDKQLIARGRTWACPVENLEPLEDGPMMHKNGLITLG